MLNLVFFKSYLGKEIETIIESKIANLPTKYGNFDVKAYKDGCQEHLAIMSKNFKELKKILTLEYTLNA